jgi:cytoskeleton protein RodZ
LSEDPLISAGQLLRQERERKSVSLESVSQATRITLANLEALEKDDFEFFPAPLFVRSFLRTYAAHIGIDAGKIIAIYEKQTESMGEARKKTVSEKEAGRRRVTYILPLALVALAIGVILALFGNRPSAPPAPVPAPAPAAPAVSPTSPEVSPAPPAAPPESAPAGTALAPSPPPPAASRPADMAKAPEPAAQPEKKPEKLAAAAKPADEEAKQERRHILKIKALEKTWLRLQPDDQPAIDALLQPQETATWTARRQFKVILGNAGGAEISFNGTPQKRLGESGQVVKFILPASSPRPAEKRPPQEKEEQE